MQFRAVMGAPDMPEDAVQRCQDDLSKMVETEDSKNLIKEDGLVTQNLQDEKFTAYFQEKTEHRRRSAAGTRLEEGSVTEGVDPTSQLAKFVAEHDVAQIPETVLARRTARVWSTTSG